MRSARTTGAHLRNPEGGGTGGKHEKNRAGQQNHDFPADLKKVKHLEMRNDISNNLSVSSAPVHARGMPERVCVLALQAGFGQCAKHRGGVTLQI